MISKSEEFVPNLFTNLDVAAGQVYPMFDKAGARCDIGTLRQIEMLVFGRGCAVRKYDKNP